MNAIFNFVNKRMCTMKWWFAILNYNMAAVNIRKLVHGIERLQHAAVKVLSVITM